jgi:peptide chain release factor 1
MDSVILEIRPGTGGEEAMLFAHDLFRMYKKYGEQAGWKITVLEAEESENGGLRSIAAQIRGAGVQRLLNESGVHRVQRIPATERGGRIHTSTASVAILPKPKEAELTVRPQDIRIDVFRASGPGGQYVNKRESAVRVTHLATGITVVSQTGRTQIHNREYALALLRTRLKKALTDTEKTKERALRQDQIGKGERAEKIRTYNFLQDRVTDHRIKKSWYGIERIMEGNMEPIMKALENYKTIEL